MVKKLFKHEFLAALRLWFPMQIIVIAVAVFGRIIQFFKQDTVIFEIVSGSSGVIFVISIFASVMLTLIFGIVRFYKNLFSNEGYLTFTLPVTVDQHIMVKTVVGSVSMVGSLLVALVALMIFTAGEMFAELLKAADYLLDQLAGVVGGGNVVAYLLEAILLLVLYIVAMYLLYYGCISLGQTFKKNRIIGAVGVYFIYYIITQVFGTVLVVFGSVLVSSGMMESISNFMIENFELFLHLCFAAIILWEALLSVVFYCINRYVIRNKLNLE